MSENVIVEYLCNVCKMFVEKRRDRRKLLFISISGDPICFKSGHQHPGKVLQMLILSVFEAFFYAFDQGDNSDNIL